MLLLLFCLLTALFAVYAAFTLALLRAWRQLPVPDPKPAKARAAVIIPVRNEEANIGLLLADLEAQTHADFEVAVVDDQSTDGTAAVVEGFVRRGKLRLRLLRLDPEVKKAHKKAAILAGIEATEGDWVVTTDGDCRVGPRWLERVVGFGEETGAKLVSAGVCFHGQRGWFERVQTVEFLSLIGAGAASMHLGMPNMCNGANLAYRREAFWEVGGFSGVDHLASGDDEFLMHKIHHRHLGGRVRFLKHPEALVFTGAQPSFWAFFQQRKRWASKWNHYRNWQAVAVAVFVYAFHAAALGLMLGAWWLPGAYAAWGAGLLALKVAVEYPYLAGLLDFCGLRRLRGDIWLTELLHSPYIVWIGIAGKLGRYEWKGRRA
jgi:cellulose synthase/poly-beta-1,6-N-acetylglucosamine synthase-like glycosyltransferase